MPTEPTGSRVRRGARRSANGGGSARSGRVSSDSVLRGSSRGSRAGSKHAETKNASFGDPPAPSGVRAHRTAGRARSLGRVEGRGPSAPDLRRTSAPDLRRSRGGNSKRGGRRETEPPRSKSDGGVSWDLNVRTFRKCEEEEGATTRVEEVVFDADALDGDGAAGGPPPKPRARAKPKPPLANSSGDETGVIEQYEESDDDDDDDASLDAGIADQREIKNSFPRRARGMRRALSIFGSFRAHPREEVVEADREKARSADRRRRDLARAGASGVIAAAARRLDNRVVRREDSNCGNPFQSRYSRGGDGGGRNARLRALSAFGSLFVSEDSFLEPPDDDASSDASVAGGDVAVRRDDHPGPGRPGGRRRSARGSILDMVISYAPRSARRSSGGDGGGKTPSSGDEDGQRQEGRREGGKLESSMPSSHEAANGPAKGPAKRRGSLGALLGLVGKSANAAAVDKRGTGPEDKADGNHPSNRRRRRAKKRGSLRVSLQGSLRAMVDAVTFSAVGKHPAKESEGGNGDGRCKEVPRRPVSQSYCPKSSRGTRTYKPRDMQAADGRSDARGGLIRRRTSSTTGLEHSDSSSESLNCANSGQRSKDKAGSMDAGDGKHAGGEVDYSEKILSILYAD